MMIEWGGKTRTAPAAIATSGSRRSLPAPDTVPQPATGVPVVAVDALGAHGVIALQRRIGNRAVSRLLAGPTSSATSRLLRMGGPSGASTASGGNAAAAASTRLPTGWDVLDRLKQIPQVAEILAKAPPLPQGPDVQRHMLDVMRLYERSRAQGHDATRRGAMLLITILGNLGRALALALGDAGLQPALTKAFVRANGDAIRDALADGTHGSLTTSEATRAVAHAEYLGGSQLLERYLKGKVSGPRAVLEIREMAAHVGETPSAVLAMLEAQLETELESYSAEDLARGHVKSETTTIGIFPLENLPGELSPQFVADVIGRQTASGRARPRAATVGLLAPLRAVVKAWDAASIRAGPRTPRRSAAPGAAPASADHPPLPEEHLAAIEAFDPATLKHPRGVAPPPGMPLRADDGGEGAASLTPRQYAHLQDLGREDRGPLAKGERPGMQDERKHRSVDEYLARAAEGDAAWAGVSAGQFVEVLERCSLTIALHGDRVFGGSSDPAFGVEYQSAQQQRGLLFSVEREAFVDEAGHSDGTTPTKGPTSGVRVFRPTEAERGERGQNYLRYRLDKDTRQTRDRGFSMDEWAKFASVHVTFEKTGGKGDPGLFGDTILVLKPEIRNRSTFSWGTRGAEHRTMLALLVDIVDWAGRGSKIAWTTLLALRDIVAGRDPAAGFQPHVLEAHIYGELSLVADLETIVCLSGVTPRTRNNIWNFCDENGIGFRG